MIDKGKALKGLECCTHGVDKCAICPYDPRYIKNDEINARSCMTQLAMDALELLKAQEPVKPERACSGGGITWWNVCGYCKTAINPNDKFCHECGKAVKWE